MDECLLPVSISALACIIAEHIESNTELALVAALFTQLGDTLASISAARTLTEKQSR